jgi:hypothetical protein
MRFPWVITSYKVIRAARIIVFDNLRLGAFV